MLGVHHLFFQFSNSQKARKHFRSRKHARQDKARQDKAASHARPRSKKAFAKVECKITGPVRVEATMGRCCALPEPLFSSCFKDTVESTRRESNDTGALSREGGGSMGVAMGSLCFSTDMHLRCCSLCFSFYSSVARFHLYDPHLQVSSAVSLCDLRLERCVDSMGGTRFNGT